MPITNDGAGAFDFLEDVLGVQMKCLGLNAAEHVARLAVLGQVAKEALDHVQPEQPVCVKCMSNRGWRVSQRRGGKMKPWASFVFGLALLGPPCFAQFLGSVPAQGEKSTTENAALLQSLLQARRPILLFRADDVISVQVYGIKDYSVEQRVAEDGSIIFPLVGKVQVAGLTVEQLENTLAGLLAKSGMVREPQVTVNAISRPWAIVTVSGDVVRAGTFPAYGDLTVMDYLSQAGGLNDNLPTNPPTNSPASSVVTLVRSSLEEPVSIPLGPNPKASPFARIPLFPGDELRVSKVGVVYAVGAFKTQGAYPLKNSSPTTLMQLVALAGGIGFEANKDAYLIRTEGRSKYIFELDVSQIMKGRTADMALQSDDILFAPTNKMRAAIKGGGAAVIVSLASAYLYARP